MNINVEDGDYNMKSQILDKNLVSKQLERLEKIRQERNQSIVDEKLLSLKSAADGDMNLIDPMIDAYRSGATIGEVNGVLRSSFGTWIAPSGV